MEKLDHNELINDEEDPREYGTKQGELRDHLNILQLRKPNILLDTGCKLVRLGKQDPIPFLKDIMIPRVCDLPIKTKQP